MADYKKMYTKLLNATTDAINLLQKAQLETEETFIETPETVLTMVDMSKKAEDSKGSC